MAGTVTRSLVGMGVSAAMWAAVVLGPTELSAERAPDLQPEAEGIPPAGPVADAFWAVDDRLAVRAPELELDERGRLAAAIVLEATKAELDPLLVLAVIEVESSFDPAALSGAGARGLMQLREPTLRSELRRHGLDVDLRDPVVNVRAGVRYLRRLNDAFPDPDVALMAYNAGPNRILGYLRAGEIPERFHVYPRRVKAVLRRLKRTPVVPASTELAAAPALAGSAAGRMAD